jgi:hypothetical protein
MEVTVNRVCACGRSYSARAWAALPLHTRLTEVQIASLASPWPTHLVVEIRVCLCKRRMARLCNRAALTETKDKSGLAA